MKTLAIIPARGGSKGVPGKNRKVICGKPLINYTFDVAALSRKITKVVVSSDDDLLLEWAKAYSFDLHHRPHELATDNSPIVDTVRDILERDQVEYDAVMLLQPTSPLRTAADLDQAIDLLEGDSAAFSVISVISVHDMHPARMYTMDGSYLQSFLPQFQETRRQDIPPAYYRNGSIYLTRYKRFLETNSLMTGPIIPYVMDAEWLLNIDTPRDIWLAEALIPEWKKVNNQSL